MDCDSGCPEHTCLSCCNDLRVRLEAEVERLREGITKLHIQRRYIGTLADAQESVIRMQSEAIALLKRGSDTPNVSYETPSVRRVGDAESPD